MSIYSLLANKPSVSYLEEHLDGNLCRCTGYRPIWDAARSLCADGKELVRGPCGTPCRECPERDACEQDCNVQDKQTEENLCCSSSKDKMQTYKDTFLADRADWAEQPIRMFPKELLDPNSSESLELSKPLMIVDRTEFHAGGTWFKPNSLMEMLILLREFGGTGTGSCKIVVGNTEVGIETRFKHAVYPRLLSPSESIPELYGFEASDDTVFIGSCCSLSTIQYSCEALSEKNPFLKRTLMPVHDMLRWFASTQIRNVACLGGNLVTASPISDLNPMLACMNAKLTLACVDESKSSISRRSVAVSEFFLRYRVVNLKPYELLEQIEVPVLQQVFEYLKPFKQARRREDDISIVTSGIRIKLKVGNGKWMIDDVALAFGGMSIKTVLATETATSMVGQEFCASTFENAKGILLDEMNLPEGVPGGQAAFRMTLTTSFLHKFYLSVLKDLREDVAKIESDPSIVPGLVGKIPALPDLDVREASGTENFLSMKKPSYSGVQKYPPPKVANGLEEKTLPLISQEKRNNPNAVGRPLAHMSGSLHCTGEALFNDDIPIPPGTLQAALVLSDRCGVTMEEIDPSPALALPGVFGVYTYDDLFALGGRNALGPILTDETVFLPRGERIRTVGQVLGIVVGETLESAELGARVVKVTYGTKKENIVVTIEDAISAGSFYEVARHGMERGDTRILDSLASQENTGGEAKPGDIVKISGSFSSGAQEHFYLEPNSTLVIPSESDTNLTIYASTQAPTKTQTFCASCTGTPASKVVVRMKRMGGGFGGKETRSVFVSCAAAVAAKASGRPVRLTLSRDVDMSEYIVCNPVASWLIIVSYLTASIISHTRILTQKQPARVTLLFRNTTQVPRSPRMVLDWLHWMSCCIATGVLGLIFRALLWIEPCSTLMVATISLISERMVFLARLLRLLTLLFEASEDRKGWQSLNPLWITLL